ncbi:hypothetical protein QNI16_34430 [Cytophagaceae bacterium YF14B1]|uniref:6-bladed beta-propeller n=1 Tax=Xanthocytophaga flava TaxID=3048013 RepID=A0AAE3U9Z9_9BACT|nr:hypothetical protein [Xanthocytophaga flavus]MDJ1485639.1 hypothetical protein [Xanthocytophaga flavus]
MKTSFICLGLLVSLITSTSCTEPNPSPSTSGEGGHTSPPIVTIKTIAGKDTKPGYADGTGTNSQFDNPCQMTIDKNDNIYIIDQLKSYIGGTVIRKLDPQGNVTTFATGFGAITDICVDPRDGVTLYAVDSGDKLGVPNGIFRITSTGQVTRLSTSTRKTYEDGPLATAKFDQPVGIVMDKQGNLYIADGLERCVRKVNLTTGMVSTFAGKVDMNTQICNYKDGAANVAEFCRFDDLTMDDDGNLYIPDWFNHRIRKIAPDGTVSTYIGLGTGYGKDCPLEKSTVYEPHRVHYDSYSKQLFVVDQAGLHINMVTTNNYVFRLTNHVLSADYADTSPGHSNTCYGLVVNKKGEVIYLDKYNHCIRKATYVWPN